jgi:hypothetical protein
MKYVVDTSLINRLVDGSIHADELPKDGSFVASHIQIDELNRTKNGKRGQSFSKSSPRQLMKYFQQNHSCWGPPA